MTFLTYTAGIPNTPNNPSNDQPIMKVNNDSNNIIWGIDHHGFNDNQGGWHNIIRMPVGVPAVPPPAILLPAPVGQVFVNTVGTDVQLFYESSLGVVTQLTNSTGSAGYLGIKAWALAGVGGIIGGESFNVVSVTRASMGLYNVVITPGVLNGTGTFMVLVSSALNAATQAVVGNYILTGPSTFNLDFVLRFDGSQADPLSFSFQVMQK
jgi:hypothetical protein